MSRRVLIALGAFLLLVPTLLITFANPAQAATITQTSSCVDGGGHLWLGRSVWGDPYNSSGVIKASNDSTGFTSAAPDADTVDYSVQSFNADGSLAQTQSESDREFDFDSGTTYLIRNPRNPVSGPGQAKIVVSVGDGNDGASNCTMTFVQPGVAPPSPPPTSPPPPSSGQSPVGGYPRLAFSDDFSGSALDRSKWSQCWYPKAFSSSADACGKMNDSITLKSNVSVSGGVLALTQSSSTNGALVSTNPSQTNGVGYRWASSGYAEARVHFAGNGSNCYNWAAWWTNGPSSGFADGEHDVAEIGGTGRMTTNYHFDRGNGREMTQFTVPGYRCDGYHTYGIHRKAGSADIYVDGQRVTSYATYDGLASHELIFNTGYRSGKTLGVGQSLRVDWVRVWTN